MTGVNVIDIAVKEQFRLSFFHLNNFMRKTIILFESLFIKSIFYLIFYKKRMIPFLFYFYLLFTKAAPSKAQI